MPRPPANPAPAADPDKPELPALVPAKIDGKINPEHYRVRLARVNLMAEYAAASGNAIPFNAESLTKMILREAEMAGLRAETLADARSEGDKIKDAVLQLVTTPDSIWERVDEEYALLEKAMETDILAGAHKLLDGYAARTLNIEELKRLGKKMLNRLQRVRRLRTMATHPFPKKQLKLKEEDRPYWEATHPLRYMIYVSRSGTIPHKDSEHGSHVYMIGPPHVKFAVDTWIARTGVLFEDGEMRVGEKNGGCRPKKGVMLIAPPGHGKSDFASHYLALEIGLRPTTQSLYVHAVVDMAEAKQQYVANLFSRENAAGRRHLSLFPSELDRSDNNKTKMRLKLPERAASPTITACGMTTAKLGADSTIQVFDDIVPQSDVDQPTERARRFKQFSGTFATRQRGQNTFKLIIGTMWHPDDTLAKMWKISLKTDMYVLSKQATGGPVAGKKGVFEPIWPEVMPARELRRRFDEMNRDVSLWSANYMGDPIADEARIIKKIAYYDPEGPDHQSFLNGAVFHVSVDPTGTNKETSDKAGLVYAATGDVPVTTVYDGYESVAYQQRLRILETREVHANQVELAEAVATFTANRAVAQVHVECRSGYHATADILENRYGVIPVRHDPTNKDKAQRLKQCAGVIDASLAGMPPLVEFPGERKDNGTIGPSDRYRDLYSQFIDFGYSDNDHLVDAVTQLTNWLLRNQTLVAGGAPTDSAVPDRMRLTGDPRIHAMLDEWAKKPNTHEQEEMADWEPFKLRRSVA